MTIDLAFWLAGGFVLRIVNITPGFSKVAEMNEKYYGIFCYNKATIPYHQENTQDKKILVKNLFE